MINAAIPGTMAQLLWTICWIVGCICWLLRLATVVRQIMLQVLRPLLHFDYSLFLSVALIDN